MKKAIIVSTIAAFLLGAIGWQLYLRIFSDPSLKARKRPQPVPAVETARVKTQPVSDIGIFTGSLYPRSQFVVAPKVAGRIEKIHVRIGDRVHRHQLIAELESDEFRQQTDQAKAELDVAKANLQESKSSYEAAARELERVRTLRQKRIASESELDSAESNYTALEARNRVAFAQVAQKEAALKAAQVRLSYTQIRAFWEEGDAYRVVAERFVDEGAMLAANNPIVSLMEISALTAVIHVIEKDYPKIVTGQEAELVTDAYPTRRFKGVVMRKAPFLKEMTRSARVELEVPNAEGLLKPGMFIRAAIVFEKIENACMVPVQAIVKRGGLEGVFTGEGNPAKAVFREVKTGLREKDHIQVISPELSGEVITLGNHLLEDGSLIKIPGVASPTKGKETPSGTAR